jgi:hypothetical protein
MHRSASTTPTNLFNRSTSLARIGGGNFQRVDVWENVDDDGNHQAVIAFFMSHCTVGSHLRRIPSPVGRPFEVHPAASLGDSS